MNYYSNKIPYGSHYLDDEDIQAVVDVLKNHPITQGNTIQLFGEALADYVGADYCLPVSNGTAALHLSVAALGISTGDEVITTPMTFCATSNAVLYQGGAVQFVDVDKNSLNIDISLIEEKINEKTKAIIPVDFRGHPSNLPEIKELADRYNLKVIEDGAHSLGSKYTYMNKQYSCGDGAHVDFCTFSFHPVKHITTGEGGAILTNDPELYRKVFLLGKHGIDRREEMFNEKKRIGSWIYDMELLGYNYRISDFQAAMGLTQLKKINSFKNRRRKIVNYYNDEFSDIEQFILPYEAENVDSNFHLYVLQISDDANFDRYDFFTYLQSLNYAPMVLYLPVHLLSYYMHNFGYKRGDYPIAERYYDRSIAIPLYPSLTDTEVEKVVQDIKKFAKLN